MAASIERAIRRSLMEIIQGTAATPAERLEACKLLWKDLASAKGKPWGKPFQKKVDEGRDSKDRLWRIIHG